MRDTAEWYREFARQVASQSEVYEQWATAVADDDSMLAIIEALPEAKRQPPLVFAVARLLGAGEGDSGDFKRFLIAHAAEVQAECRARPMQTNEPQRCAALLPALTRMGGPLALIELGASAGLCLYVDRFSYDYALDGDAETRVRLDPANGPSTVTLSASAPSALVPHALPEVAWRGGIDLRPLNAADEGDAAWLTAMVWPGQRRRLARVRAAIDIARADPPHLLAGDAIDRLADALAAVPPGTTPVVVTAGVLVYIPFAERMRLVDAIRQSGARWVSLEGAGVLPEVRERLPQGDHSARFVVALDEHPIAFCSPHGDELAALG
ncbi:DUF2332 domain-containing protein [Homoserinimonas hongtaonis]|uniref:DUF2332 domain-containing protein n=1 Tax=Homoserinimonas hongtaonis TaxID=2079791 RepID=UPI000D3C9558|nr:DUF2332 domain-containing protein [Salinibacterium hongtaonis]AWB88425.1 DUF2332 domain-containing protein [Salinibacterium hongtaonis]